MSMRKNTSGFTLVELLIVIVVIAVLASITLVVYKGIQDRAKAAVVQSDLSQAAKQLAMDKAVTGSFPSNTGSANGGSGLRASSGTSYQYTVDNVSNPPTFCLSGVNGNQEFHITNSGATESGVCSGHTGSSGGSSLSCASGYIPVPGDTRFGTNDFCVAKYEAKNVGGVATSQASGLPWVNVTQPSAITLASGACAGCRLISEAEWLTIAHNLINVASNWSGGAVGSGYIYSGHNDANPAGSLAASSNDGDGYYGTPYTAPNNQRRTLTLSNGEVIWDFAGNASEWTTGQTTGGQPGASGYAFRDWNNVGGTGSLTPNPFPSYGTPAASAWNNTKGIGMLYSDSSETALRGFIRSGRWGYNSYAGIFTLILYAAPTDASPGFIGFRITRP